MSSDALPTVVREQIVARIQSGEWRPGQRLPAEPELAAAFGVSRTTLREALRSLAEDGFITRTRRAGTFVTHRPRLVNNLDVNFGVSDLIRAVGLRPGTENLKVFEAVASPGEAERLAIPEGSRLTIVERVRTADDHPVVFSRDLIPGFLLDGHGELVEHLGQRSIYDMLERLGVEVVQGVATLRPAKADRRLASQLRVAKGTLLFHVVQVDYDNLGRPVLLTHEDQVADAFEVTVVRRGPKTRVRGHREAADGTRHDLDSRRHRVR
jgi:GntR family transcriptional regulator